MKEYIKNIVNLIVASLIFCSWGIAQENPKNIGHAISFSFSYGMYTPSGDLAERFGFNFGIGSSLEFLHEDSRLIYGVDVSFLFGNNVEEDVLANLRNDGGLILGIDGSYADIFLRQRGLFAGLTFGKIFNVYPAQKKSGIRLSISPGILQHWIRIQDDSGTVPQVQGDYEKGYDHLTSGFGLKQYIGYQLFSNNKRLNFYAGFEFMQGFTKSSRDLNFDTQMADSESRLDLLWGFKVGLYIPFYVGRGEGEVIFY